jgi:hypothetical protein
LYSYEELRTLEGIKGKGGGSIALTLLNYKHACIRGRNNASKRGISILAFKGLSAALHYLYFVNKPIN